MLIGATIVCLHCGKMQDVARKAMTITCKHCSKSLRLEDLRFKEYQARRVIEDEEAAGIAEDIQAFKEEHAEIEIL